MRSLVLFGPVLLLATFLAMVFGLEVLLTDAVPSESALTVASISLCLFILYWVMLDARRRGRVGCHDFGFLMGVFFPVSLVWYLVATRGWRGVVVLVGIALVFLLPSVATMIAWTIRYGS